MEASFKKGWTREKMEMIKLSECRQKCCEKHNIGHCAACKSIAEAFHCREWKYFEFGKFLNILRRRHMNLMFRMTKINSPTRSNMYRLSVKQWSPFVGCEYDCRYCKPSFQAQCKRRWSPDPEKRKNIKNPCKKCYDYIPHTHPELLKQKLPRTGYMQFIFCCSNGDIAFCSTDYLLQIIDVIKQHPDRWFLIQSKNPETFNRVEFPRNVILGTTVESNKKAMSIAKPELKGVKRIVIYRHISNAPETAKRVFDLQAVEHRYKMLTYEPLLQFDLEVMVSYAELINPCMIWMGYDSKNTGLPEPSLAEFRQLHWELARRGFVVILKTVRERNAMA